MKRTVFDKLARFNRKFGYRIRKNDIVIVHILENCRTHCTEAVGARTMEIELAQTMNPLVIYDRSIMVALLMPKYNMPNSSIPSN